MTASDQLLLEQSFQDTYNLISYATCDKEFKRINKVELMVNQANQRYLQEQQMARPPVPTGLDMFENFMDFNGTINATSTSSNWTFNSAPISYAPHLSQTSVFKVEGLCRNCLSDGGKFLLVSIWHFCWHALFIYSHVACPESNTCFSCFC